MDIFGFIFIIIILTHRVEINAKEEPTLYYYGLEESERSLPACDARQACAALLQRYWRAPALVRLCRCERRRRCDTPAPNTRLIELNNRAHLQFCEPVTDWPECAIHESPLSVETLYERMNPDELEELHHQGKHLFPPRIVLTCRCRYPNYWRLSNESDTKLVYQCASLPVCKSGEYCGNVNSDLMALHQSCECPRRHMCVHGGGLPRLDISELLYRGKGWRAYCQPVSDDLSYEDY